METLGQSFANLRQRLSQAVVPFDDPPTWKHHKTFLVIRAFDNFNFAARPNVASRCGTFAP
jgi:hypothetical protein